MSHPNLAVVTGAFGYTGRFVARGLLDRGVRVRTLTRRHDRANAFGGRVDAAPLDFSDPDGLCRSLEGAGVLYNTYWVRFARGQTTFDLAVENSTALFGQLRGRASAESSTFPSPTPRQTPGGPTSGAKGRWKNR